MRYNDRMSMSTWYLIVFHHLSLMKYIFFTMMANSLSKISENIFFFPEGTSIQQVFCEVLLSVSLIPLSSNKKFILPKEKKMLK